MIVRSVAAISLVIAIASPASAQSGDRNAPPMQAQPQRLGGPAVPGVCLLSREAIFANAAVGKAASTRLQDGGLTLGDGIEPAAWRCATRRTIPEWFPGGMGMEGKAFP